MKDFYVLQYKYETIGEGEWIDEFQSHDFDCVKHKMLNHIGEFEELVCRIILRKCTVKEYELGSYVPAHTWRQEEEA